MRKANFFGKKKKSVATVIGVNKPKPLAKPPVLRKPGPGLIYTKPSDNIKVDKKPVRPSVRQTNVLNIIPDNFQKSNYSKEEIDDLFKSCENLSTYDEIKEKINEFIENDVENSYVSEILSYIVETFNLIEVKFIINLFLKSEIKSLGLFFEKFLKNKENIITVAKLTKFINSLSKDDPDYKTKILQFGSKNIIYESLLKEIVSDFDKDLIFLFLYGFTSQGSYLFDDYFSIFVREHKNKIKELEKQKKEKQRKENEDRMKKIEDVNKKRENAINTEKVDICKKYFTELPWIPNAVVVKTFLLNTSNGNNSIVFDDLVDINSKVLYKNKYWYEAGDKFYKLLCNESVTKEQQLYNTVFKDKNDSELITVSIAYKNADNEIFVQDDIIFSHEKTFFANINKELNDYSVQQILDSSLTPEIISFGKTFFRNALQKISDTTKYDDISYILNDLYTVREFATTLGNVIVYLDIDNISDSSFKKRIQKEYFNYNVLFKLSKNEKIPELLINDEQYVSFVNNYIDKKIHDFVYKFGENIYIIKQSFTQSYVRKEFDENKPKVKYISLKDVCDTSVKDLVENLVIYKDGEGKTDCYQVKDVIEKINRDVQSFSRSFVNHMRRIYDFSSILHPISIKKEFPLVSEMISQILSFDDTLIRYEVEKNLGLYDINADILIKENQDHDNEEVEEEVEEEEDEEEEDEDIPENSSELEVVDDDKDDEETVLDEDELDENIDENEGIDENLDENLDDENEDDENEDKNKDETTDDETTDDETTDDEETDEETEDEPKKLTISVNELIKQYESEKIRQNNKFNDYTGISETLFDDDEKTISRHYVKGDGDCFFRSLYLAILYNDIKNFRKLNSKIQPRTVIFESKKFSDVNEFAKKCRQYISDNYDSILNNIIEMGFLLEDDEIYPSAEDALFGEAGNCYIRYRAKNHKFKKNEVVDVKRDDKWVRGKILDIENVDDDDNTYKIQYETDDEEEEDVIASRIMKKDRVRKFFDCAKNQIFNKDIYPSYGEIGIISDLISDTFEVKNIILPSFYTIKISKTDKIESNIEIKDILDKYGNVKNSFNTNDTVLFRKSSFIKGKISKKVNSDTYNIEGKKKEHKNIRLNNITTRDNKNKKSFEIGEKVLFRQPFKKGKIVEVVNDSTMNKHLSEESKQKIMDEISKYEENKDRTKIQIYLLTDNTHYNFIALEKDDLQVLELSSDGNFTNNLLNYLDENTMSSENDSGNEETFSDFSDNEDTLLTTKSCANCDSAIYGNTFFKTKNFNKNTHKLETIYFCHLNCFRDYEKWIKK